MYIYIYIYIHEYIYIYIYISIILLLRKLFISCVNMIFQESCICLEKMSVSKKILFCFECMICSFKNMTYEKKVIYLLSNI